MGIFGLGRYRTLKLKVPRKCEWCEVRVERIIGDLKTLEDRVNQIEANFTVDQAIQLTRLKLETSSHIFTELTRGQAPVAITPAQLEGMISLYKEIVELTDELIQEPALHLGDRHRDQNRPPKLSKAFTSPTFAMNGHSSHAVPPKA